MDLLSQSWYPQAPPLPPPAGKTIKVTTVEELFAAAQNVQPGETILIADGHYMMPTVFTINTDRVTVRSESGDRSKVILDGADSAHGELFGFTECHGSTVADLTIQNIMHNGFKFNGNLGRSVRDLNIYNCVMHNIWQRGVKSVSGPEATADSDLPPRPSKDGTPPLPRHFVDGCSIRYCLFYNDRPKRFEDDSYELENPDNFGGNYIAGLDVMSARGWAISDNVLINIKGRTGGSRGAIFLWQGSEDVRIERNIVIDCDSGMWLGLSYPPDDNRSCVRYLVANNFITRPRCAGILLGRQTGSRILHNTICDPVDITARIAGTDIDDGGVLFDKPEPRCRPLRIGLDNENLLVANNLMNGPSDIHVNECAGQLQLRHNLWLPETTPSPFVDPDRGNLHLKPEAKEMLTVDAIYEEVSEDIDGRTRGEAPTPGAHEIER